jgi:dATP pyrophosphohydrolase
MLQPNFIAAYIVDPTSGPYPLFLLLKRAPEAYLGGIWQIVTGKVDKGHSVLETVKKEILEETGLRVENAYNVNVTLFYEKVKDQVGFSSNFLVFLDYNEKIILSPREHVEYCWCSFEEAFELLAFSTQKETLVHINQFYIDNKPNQASLVVL